MSNSFNQFRQLFKRLSSRFQQFDFGQSPVAKIMLINTGIFFAWKLKLIPQQFMVKHFSFERFNVRNYRWHTFLTYAFSHLGFFSYFFNMLTLFFFGRAIYMQYGAKYIYWLYGLGAIFGSLSMNYFMPYYQIVMPQVGADPCVSAMFTFYGLFNLQQRVLFFFFPMPIWALLGIVGVYSLILDPTKRNFGGMMAGLLVYQMFRMKFI